MGSSRASLLLLLVLLFGACEEAMVPEPLDVPGPARVGMAISSVSAAPGSTVVLVVEPVGEGDAGAVHGTLRFDPARLRFTGTAQTPGDLLVVNDRDAGWGALRLVSLDLDASGRTAATLTFEVLRPGFDKGLAFEPATGGGEGRRGVDRRRGVLVERPSAAAVDSSRRVAAAAWAEELAVRAPSSPLAGPFNGPPVGDCEPDGVGDIFDVLAIAQIMTGIRPVPQDSALFQACDVDGDGVIGVLDVLELGRQYVGASGEEGQNPLRVVSASILPRGSERSPYRLVLRAAGGDGASLRWVQSGGRLPSGLGLTEDGTLSGTPTTSGSYSFTASVSSGQETASKTFSLRIEPSFAREAGDPGSGDCPAAASDRIEPDFCEDFGSYRSTAELHANPHGWLWWRFPEHIELSPVAPAGQSRSVRYTYNSRDDEDHENPRGRVNFRQALRRENASFQEIWTEVKFRFSGNFTVEGHPSYQTDPDPPAAGFKLLHTHYYRLEPGFSGPNRFGIAFHSGDGGELLAKQGGANWDNQYFHDGTTLAGDPAAMFDGTTWHVIRQHIRVGPDGANLPHLMEWWLNGQYQGISRARHPGSGVPYLYALEFGINMNRFAPADQHIWWAHVKIWTRDPGW
jgi:hypothetical protein